MNNLLKEMQKAENKFTSNDVAALTYREYKTWREEQKKIAELAEAEQRKKEELEIIHLNKINEPFMKMLANHIGASYYNILKTKMHCNPKYEKPYWKEMTELIFRMDGNYFRPKCAISLPFYDYEKILTMEDLLTHITPYKPSITSQEYVENSKPLLELIKKYKLQKNLEKELPINNVKKEKVNKV